MSDSLRPHELQHARPPCPSPTPGVHSDSHLSSQWCHPAISSSVIPFASCPQSLPASESFPVSQLFAWGGQSTGVSALASFLPKKSQGWSPSEWTGWISLQSKRLSRVFSNTTSYSQIWLLILAVVWSLCWGYQSEHLHLPVAWASLQNGVPELHNPRERAVRWKLYFFLCSSLRSHITPLLITCYSLRSEKAMAPHSSTLAWKIPWTEEPGGLQSMRSLRVGHDWATSLSLFTFMHWRRKWQPTPVFLPGESQGRGSLVGCHLWGLTQSDTTEVT